MSDINLVIRYENGNLKVVSKEAEKELKKSGKKSGKEFSDEFSDQVKKSKPFSGLKSGLSNLKNELTSFKSIAFFGSVAFGLKKATDAALVQEEAVTRMNAALKVSGDFSQRASNQMQAFASSLQDVSRFGDEAILDQIALAKAFGATNSQAKQILEAAVDLSAAFSIDLQSAVRNVAKTLGGFAGELGESIPELKSLTQEQLKAGKGIELLANRYKGAGKESLNTFASSTDRLSNAFGDLLEGVGDFIIKNPVLISSFKSLTEVLASSARGMKGLAQSFNRLFKDDSIKPIDVANKKMSALGKSLSTLVKREKELSKEGMFESLFGADRLNRLEKVRGRIKGIKTERSLLRKEMAKLLEARKLENTSETKNAGAIALTNEQLRQRQLLEQKLANIGLTRVQQLEAQQAQQLEILKNAQDLKIESLISYKDREAEVERQFTEQIQAENSKRVLDSEATLGNIGKSFVEYSKTVKVTSGQVAATLQNVLARGVGNAFKGIGAALASGENAQQAFADAAKNAVADAASALGDFYITDGVARIAKSYGADATGYQLVAAGSAMKLLSGVLGGSGGGAGASAGGGTTAGSTSFVEPDTIDEGFSGELETSAKPQTVLNINVEGNVVDNEAFVRNLVQEIGEEGGKQGLVFDNFATV